MTQSTGFMRHIERCTHYDMSKFVPFVVGEKKIGYVRRETAVLIDQEAGFQMISGQLVLSPLSETMEMRTAALRRASDILSHHFDMPLEGEIYPVIKKWGDTPLAHIDRAAIPWFGVKGNGVHANGYVRKGNDIYLWVGQRAKDRKIEPGKLDNIIGGGCPLGYSLEENFAKEAWEEAGIKESTLSNAKLIHGLSYMLEKMNGLRNDTLFVFDLELSLDVIPENTDGEVERFELIPAEDVVNIVHDTDRFKFNCNVVMIDFFMRHGLINPDHPEYEALDHALNEMRKA